MTSKCLGVVATHPIQYQAPWFRALAAHPQFDLHVFFCHKATPHEQAAAGFGVEFDWDRSLLDGYEHSFLRNVASRPSIDRFRDLDTPEIREIISSGRFDAIIVNGWNYRSAWQAMRACWHTGTPLMVRSDSHLLTERALPKRATKWPLYRWFIPKIDACLPVGTWSRDYFLHYGAKPDKVFVVPHVIDDHYFTEQAVHFQSSRNDLRSRWSLDQETFVFLFAGKFTETKRPMDFVRAIARAANNNVKLTGLMVGDGPLRATCEQFSRENDLPIRFTGFLNQSEISQAYVAADALVLPSAADTWGLVVNEAMTCGRACLVTDRVGCGPDLIVSGKTGEIFRHGDIEQLGRLMSQWASEPERVKEMGVAAREKIAGYSINAGVEVVCEAVKVVTAQK
jgi:glycosyltransferase involved in cell wall biosynthesis